MTTLKERSRLFWSKVWNWREILNKVFLHRIRLVSREASSRVSGARGKGAEQCLISYAWWCWASEGARKAECMLNQGGTSETTRNYPRHCCVAQTTAGGQSQAGPLDGFLSPLRSLRVTWTPVFFSATNQKHMEELCKKKSKQTLLFTSTSEGKYMIHPFSSSEKPVSRGWVSERPRPHWAFSSQRGLGLGRGVTENITWIQAELDLSWLPHLLAVRTRSRYWSIPSLFPY